MVPQSSGEETKSHNCILCGYYETHTYVYSTAYIQVYKKTHVMRRALRNFEDNSYVGLVQHKEYTARERLLMS